MVVLKAVMMVDRLVVDLDIGMDMWTEWKMDQCSVPAIWMDLTKK